MNLTAKQAGLLKKKDPKGSAGKFLQKDNDGPPPASQAKRKVLGLKSKRKPPPKRKGPPPKSGSSAKKGQPAGQHKPPPWMHVAKGK